MFSNYLVQILNICPNKNHKNSYNLHPILQHNIYHVDFWHDHIYNVLEVYAFSLFTSWIIFNKISYLVKYLLILKTKATLTQRTENSPTICSSTNFHYSDITKGLSTRRTKPFFSWCFYRYCSRFLR